MLHVSRRGRNREHGQALVMFVLGLTLVMGAAALVIDVGFLKTDTARLQNALDAGALAAAQQLPANSTTSAGVTATAQAFVHNNYPSVAASSVTRIPQLERERVPMSRSVRAGGIDQPAAVAAST